MKLSQQVCSLELAKKLKKLNCKQESLWYWDCLNRDEPELCLDNQRGSIINKDNYYEQFEYFAFTSAELGEMLHKDTKNNDFPFYASSKSPSRTKSFRGWQCFQGNSWLDSKIVKNAETEADARAKCLIYLIENKLIEL